MWAQSMRAARISSREFSCQILSIDDWKKYRQALLPERPVKGMFFTVEQIWHVARPAEISELSPEDPDSEFALHFALR